MSNVDVEREPKRLDRIDSCALELVEAPLDDDVRGRTLDARANRGWSGCRSEPRPSHRQR